MSWSSVLDERVDIHSLHHWPFTDSSCSNSTKDCTIPILFPPAEFICLAAAAAAPHIFSFLLQRSQTVKAFSTAKSESNNKQFYEKTPSCLQLPVHMCTCDFLSRRLFLPRNKWKEIYPGRVLWWKGSIMSKPGQQNYLQSEQFFTPPNQIRKLLVSAVGKYMTSHGLRKLRDGPKTLTQTSESVSDQPTNQLTGIGARDGYASKNRHRKGLGRRISRTICLQPQVKTGTGASDSRTGSGVRWQLDWSQIELILLKYVQHKDDWVLVITRLGQTGTVGRFQNEQVLPKLRKTRVITRKGKGCTKCKKSGLLPHQQGQKISQNVGSWKLGYSCFLLLDSISDSRQSAESLMSTRREFGEEEIGRGELEQTWAGE